MNEPTDHPRLWHPLPRWFHGLAAQKPGSVLLETAKFDAENFQTLLFRDPVAELVAHSAEDVSSILRQIDRHLEDGRYVAGFVSYECGELFHNLVSTPDSDSPGVPFIRMGVFRAPLVFDHRSGEVHGVPPDLAVEVEADSAAAQIQDVELQISEQEYAKKITQIQEYLAAGDSYQVNFTDRVTGTFTGSPIALYRGLLQAQPVPYAAFMDCGAYQILSLSPELFYRAMNGRITVRPMKGTWPRGMNLEHDIQAAQDLLNDEKNRAEHVMIVDLLRNDIGMICRMGTVKVDRFMQVEHYRTLLQLTSTITGTLDAAKSPTQIFTSLFPSGSITGAPKRRTMQIIRELERHPRGIYTGAIGFFGLGGNASFNVAIRTLSIEDHRFTLGVGGGITAYSDSSTEYEECKLKASFVERLGREFQLIETMLAERETIPLLDSHLRRLEKSAAYFRIPFDEQHIRDEIGRCLQANAHSPARVRLTLDERGVPLASIAPLDTPAWAGRILLSAHRTDASNVFLHHKTTNRAVYDTAFETARKSGFDEVLFINQQGRVTEGAISNIFLRLNGVIVTPHEASGVLPGIFRQSILDRLPSAQSRPVTLEELLAADDIWLCNALRGCRPVHTIIGAQDEVLWARPSDYTQCL